MPPRSHSVRVEFDPVFTLDDFVDDLTGNSQHALWAFEPQLTTNVAGRVELLLIVPGTDLWTSVLTTMSVVRQAGYQPVAVQIHTDDDADHHLLAV
ncbi:MAG: hypothetical protein ABWX96_12240 [Propionibacteriaceae bacterium]